jgi:serine/threonine protein kinase/Flp pilus assembly protein TadD
MGVVYEAEQISLGRRVALKVLPFAGALDGKQLQRFKNEAQAAAGLHHTNIVPVHFVGCERGVHFYAMQFIDGQNLAQVIAALRHAADGEHSSRPEARPVPASAEPGAGPPPREPAADAEPTIPHSPTKQWPTSPAPDTVPQAGLATERSHRTAAYFRTAARLGQQAAEALHHAHELGVVHRDVKPGNLLLDDRGNVWVTDFGLAHLPTEASLTLSGDLVGTVRYMSPEQALAQRVGIDHRTDIYSLGATLYEMLTLRPVFAGSDRQQLLRQIAFNDPVPPRRVNKAVPAELETVVLKALEKRPEERYASAQELADDLGRFLKDEPVRAKRPTVVQRCRRWMRRHKPLVGGATAALLAALLVLAAGLGWVVGDREARRTVTDREVKLALDKAARLQHEGRLREAAAAARQAALLVDAGFADEAHRQRVHARLADLELVTDLEEARLQIAAATIDGGYDFQQQDKLYGAAFQKGRLDIDALPVEVAAARIQRSTVSTELTAALGNWALARHEVKGGSPRSWKSLLRVAQAADPDEWRNRLWDALERWDQRALLDLAGRKEVRDQLPLNLLTLATALRRMGAVKPAVALLRQARHRKPGDFWINYDLAMTLANARPPRWDEAICFFTAAVALRPLSVDARYNLGNALVEKGRLDEAKAEYDEAIRLYNVRVNKEPSLQRFETPFKVKVEVRQYILGTALWNKGRRGVAYAVYRKALGIAKGVPDSEVHYNIGQAHESWDRLDDAIAEYREALRLKKDHLEAHYHLGNALVRKDQLDEAIAEFRLGAALWKNARLFQKDGPPGLGSYFSYAHSNLGKALMAKGLFDEAIAEYRKALRIKKDYAEAYCNLGQALLHQGRFAAALKAMKQLHELSSRHAPWPYPSAQWVRKCERLMELDKRLPAILNGQRQPANPAEGLVFADLCQMACKQRFATASRFYAKAFAAEPQLAADLSSGHRYDAACAAAQAGCGQGKDADTLNAKERADLRRQALAWLRADLTAWRELLEKEPGKVRPVLAEKMQHWQKDSALAGVRSEKGLKQLPPAERGAWRQLWTKVEKTLDRARSPAK